MLFHLVLFTFPRRLRVREKYLQLSRKNQSQYISFTSEILAIALRKSQYSVCKTFYIFVLFYLNIFVFLALWAHTKNVFFCIWEFHKWNTFHLNTKKWHFVELFFLNMYNVYCTYTLLTWKDLPWILSCRNNTTNFKHSCGNTIAAAIVQCLSLYSFAYFQHGK